MWGPKRESDSECIKRHSVLAQDGEAGGAGKGRPPHSLPPWIGHFWNRERSSGYHMLKVILTNYHFKKERGQHEDSPEATVLSKEGLRSRHERGWDADAGNI